MPLKEFFPSVQIRSIIQWLVASDTSSVWNFCARSSDDIMGLPVAPNYGTCFLRRKKKTKMADSSLRRRCVSHSPFSGADFCGEGTGNFRSPGEPIWKSIWNENKFILILLRSYWPYMYDDCFLNTVFNDVFSLCESCRNNTLPRSPREKLPLVAILSLDVKSLSLQERNMLLVDHLVK